MPAVIEISHQYSGTTWFSAALAGEFCIIDLVNLYKNEDIQNRYRFCERTAINSAVGNIFKDIISMPLKGSMKIALMIAREMQGFSDERDRLQGIRNDIQEFSDYMGHATAVVALDLLAVIEHNDFGEVTIHNWRTTNTESAIGGLRREFIDRDIGGNAREELFERYDVVNTWERINESNS